MRWPGRWSVVVFAAFALAPCGAGQDAAGLALVRVEAGTRGTQRGPRYEMLDPRNSFDLATDRHVQVLFEWETRPGTYALEGRWRDPSGRVVLAAPTEQTTHTRRLTVYWTLALPQVAAPGPWSLEAWYQGRLVGHHSFELAVPAHLQPALTPAQAYALATPRVAMLQSSGSDDQPLATGLVTALDADTLLAPWSVVDGATRLRLKLPSGTTTAPAALTAWNRQEGWALVHAPGHGLEPLPRSERQTAVGDPVFQLDVVDDGSLLIGGTQIVGVAPLRSGRKGWRLADTGVVGSPILDQQGRQIGMIEGGMRPDPGPMPIRFGAPGRDLARSPRVIALAQLPPTVAGATATSLERLAELGHFARPLGPETRHVISGVFAGRVERGGVVPQVLDQRDTFSRREKQVAVFVQWNPRDKRDAISRFEVYDLDHRKVGASDGAKLKLRPGELFFSTWVFKLETLVPGLYRVDLLLDEQPIWRGFVEVTD